MAIWNWCSAKTVLPPPPNVGSQSFNASDPIGYLVGSIQFVIFLGLTIIVVFALIGFSSGLIAEVNEARKKGEWGRFSIYFAAGLLVILVVIFGAWWGSERLSAMLTV
ncbi:MAG: DUF2976 domain-containing protein [Acidiferrobacterales bacterium]|nr:DUF2976 domain-containing protein [Acidiferrobacterales bacterium]